MTAKQLLISMIFFTALVCSNAWAEETPAAAGPIPADATPISHIEGWDEEAPQEDSWTWFGMGYESRRSSMEGQGAPAAAAANPIRGGSSRK